MRMPSECAGEGNNSMIRVCLFCETWISGGIESFLCNVWTRIDSSHMEVDMVASQIGESIFTKPLLECGVHFLELSGNRRNVLENRRLFRKLIREKHYDVFYLNAVHGLSLSLLRIAKQESIPVRIAHSHNTSLRKSLTRPLKMKLHDSGKRKFTKDATDLWACSRAAADFMYNRSVLQERGFTFIPNGIDTERFRFNPEKRVDVRKKLGLDGQFVIGNVGRLCEQKNQTFLLDVYLAFLNSRPDSRLLLVGDGEDRDVLAKKAERLGISDKVLFYGTSDHVEQLLWAMDVFAFPSRFEGLGIVAVEAQAAGLPVVCSEHIPPEAYVTEQIQMIPLSSGASIWADALMAAVNRFPNGADQVRSAGFGIEDVVRKIETGYLKADPKRKDVIRIEDRNG